MRNNFKKFMKWIMKKEKKKYLYLIIKKMVKTQKKN
jgi:hypothetical protein